VSRAFAGRAAGFPDDVSCRPGCFGCCVGLFEITELDAALAERGMAKLSAAARRRIRARGRRIAAEISRIFPGDRKSLRLDPAREREWDLFFDRTARIACPFLVPLEGSGDAQDAADSARWPQGFVCAIYEQRPYTCRTFGLALSDGSRIVSPPCRLNFRRREGRAARVAASALPVRDEADLALAVQAERTSGLSAGSATVLPAVAAGRRIYSKRAGASR
jgi:Fe-S-cluster containining protein